MSTTPPPRPLRPSSGARRAYNVVDDEPAPKREWLPAYAALGWEPRWPSWREGFRDAPR
jgi:hypothetical protein